MLHFLYSSDWTLYPDERQRVQQGFLMIIHAYSGLRPSSTTQSGKRRKVKASSLEEEHNLAAKLRYGDVALILTEDDCGHARFAVRPTFKYFKGGNRRPQQFVSRSHNTSYMVVLIESIQKDLHLVRPAGRPHLSRRPLNLARPSRRSFSTPGSSPCTEHFRCHPSCRAKKDHAPLARRRS